MASNQEKIIQLRRFIKQEPESKYITMTYHRSDDSVDIHYKKRRIMVGHIHLITDDLVFMSNHIIYHRYNNVFSVPKRSFAKYISLKADFCDTSLARRLKHECSDYILNHVSKVAYDPIVYDTSDNIYRIVVNHGLQDDETFFAEFNGKKLDADHHGGFFSIDSFYLYVCQKNVYYFSNPFRTGHKVIDSIDREMQDILDINSNDLCDIIIIN